MPAQIVVVFRQAQLADRVAAALSGAGRDALSLSNSHAALDALEDADSIELLVTSIEFAPRQPNGVALARMTRLRRPRTRILFVDDLSLADHATDVGAFLSAPIDAQEIAERALQLLAKTVAR